MTEGQDWVESSSGPIRPPAYHDLQVRPGFKMALTVVQNRYWSIPDVTDPGRPRQVSFIDGPPDRWGGHEDASFEEGVLIWDITDPARPDRLSHFRTGHHGTHRNKFDEHGLLGMMCARLSAAAVIVVDPFPQRRELALRYGTTPVPLTLVPEFRYRRPRITSSQAGDQLRWDWVRRTATVALLEKMSVTEMIGARVPFPDAARPYDTIDRHPQENLGVLLTYG